MSIFHQLGSSEEKTGKITEYNQIYNKIYLDMYRWKYQRGDGFEWISVGKIFFISEKVKS
jgi:hypothetical protein